MDVNFDQLYWIEINKDIDKYLTDVYGIFYFQISEKIVILFVKWEILNSLMTKQSFRFLRNDWYFLISRVMLHIICNIYYIAVYSCLTIHLECMNNVNICDNIKNNINHLQVEF